MELNGGTLDVGTLPIDPDVERILTTWRAAPQDLRAFCDQVLPIVARRWRLSSFNLVLGPVGRAGGAPGASPRGPMVPLPVCPPHEAWLEGTPLGWRPPVDDRLFSETLGLALSAVMGAARGSALTDRMAAIKELAGQIQGRSLNEVAERLCSAAIRLGNADNACLYLLEDDLLVAAQDRRNLKRTTITLNLGRLVEEAGPLLSAPFRLDAAGLLGDAVRLTSTVVLEGEALAARWPITLSAKGQLGAAAVPILLGEEPIGVLFVVRRASGFTAEHVEVIQDLCLAVNRALITARLYADAADERFQVVERLKLLHEASMAITKATSVDAACLELLNQLPHFLAAQWQGLFLRRDGEWRYVSGSSEMPDAPPAPWLAAVHSDAKSATLEAQALVGSPLEGAGRAILMPVVVAGEVEGLLVLATETEAAPDGLEMAETLIGHAALVLQHAARLEQIERQAVTDGLTGVYNRRYFNERLQTEYQRAVRYGHPLSLIIVDLDHFKSVNDVLGHQTGDAVLVQAAKLLKSSVRQVDLVARYGGEEFVVLLPETNASSAFLVAEKLRKAVEAHVFPDQEKLPSKNITGSFGVATCHGSHIPPEKLIHSADEALYRAKQGGRNAVRSASGVEEQLQDRTQEGLGSKITRKLGFNPGWKR